MALPRIQERLKSAEDRLDLYDACISGDLNTLVRLINKVLCGLSICSERYRTSRIRFTNNDID
jgi:hypothetical protein